MTDTQPYTVPSPPGRWRSITLAAVVHAALLALLWFGVRWQNETPVAVEAEVWSPQVREAAPLPPPPEVKPEIKPEPKPQIIDPKPAVISPPVVNPEIALEQDKKRKLKEKKAREEEDRLEKKRLDAKIEAEAQKRLAAEDAKKQAAEAKKAAAEKQRLQDAAEEQRLAKFRADEMRRLTGATGTGGSGETAKSQGSRADAGYVQKVGAKIKSNTVFNVPDNVSGESAVEYAVELLPDGSLRGALRKLKSSGVAGFDEAVERAIKKSVPFPPDKSGAVPSGFILSHRPKDQ